MAFKKFMAYSCMMALIVSALTGCGDNTSKETAAATKIVQVTEIDGDQVTGTVGEWEEQDQGDRGQKPDGTPPAEDGQEPDGTPPADANQDGQNADSQSGDEQQEADSTESTEGNEDGQDADGQKGGGQKPDGTPPADEEQSGRGSRGMGGAFTAGDDSITFTITDDTEIEMEQGDSTKAAAESDIKENTILEVTLDDDNQATKIVIKGGMGGRDQGDDFGSEDASAEQGNS